MTVDCEPQPFCPTCGGTGVVVHGDEPDGPVSCARCGVVLHFGGTAIEIHGADSREVQEVASALAGQEGERRREEEAERAAIKLRDSGPWISGLFYLLAAVVLTGIVLAIVAVVPPWSVPVAILGSVLLLAIVGALQLRQDEKLSEKSFLALIKLVLSQVGRAGADPDADRSQG